MTDTDHTPIVKLVRLTPTHRKYKRGGGSTLQRAHCRAFVDGYLVTRTEGSHWRCSCLDDHCHHDEAVKAILSDEVLDQLDGLDEDDQ